MTNRRTQRRAHVKRPEQIRVHAPAWAKKKPAPLERPARSSQWRTYALRYAGITGSLAVHALVLVLAIATYTVGKQVATKVQEQAIIPDATIIEGAEVGGVPNPGLGGDPTRKAASEDGPEASSSDAWAKKPSKQLQAAVMGNAEDIAEGTIGVGGHALGATGLAGGGDGGSASPFGLPGGGGGIAPKTTFMGVSGNAKKIVYVCDFSGSMSDRSERLTQEINRSVNELKPIQGFNVIFFNDQGPIPFATGLMPANARSREALRTFLEQSKIASGSDPRNSLRMAFDQHPDLVYLLTDGIFTSGDDRYRDCTNEKVVALLRELNREKRVRINTIAFASARTEGEVTEDYIATLKLIASDSGGIYRFVSTSQH
ncbi:MAG TPA: hypothetical protein VF669_08870 [Tepidisphaeraceae bacterium]|jgi:hypothetical protein